MFIIEYRIKLYDGLVYPLTLHGESKGECNAEAIKWCLDNIGDPVKDWAIVDVVILEDTSPEHFWGLDKVN